MGTTTITKTGLEELSAKALTEISNLSEAARRLLAIRLIGEAAPTSVWAAAIAGATALHVPTDQTREYDAYRYADGSVLGDEGQGYDTWPTEADWRESMDMEPKAMVSLHSQDASVKEEVDFSLLAPSRDGAQPTNQAGCDFAYVDRMTGPDGSAYRVVFGFGQAEYEAATKGQAGDENLPWDAAHVHCAERV